MRETRDTMYLFTIMKTVWVVVETDLTLSVIHYTYYAILFNVLNYIYKHQVVLEEKRTYK